MPFPDNNPRLVLQNAPAQLFPVPAAAGNLITAVERCWVCNSVFPAYGGTLHGLVQEFHHPVPRSMGGSDGPTISLCSGHHTIVHDVEKKMLSGKPYEHLLPGGADHLSVEIRDGIITLARILVRSSDALKGDPNRRIPTTFALSNTDNQLLTRAARSRKMSRAALVQKLVEEFLRRENPTRRSAAR